jgi:hypothetical protein
MNSYRSRNNSRINKNNTNNTVVTTTPRHHKHYQNSPTESTVSQQFSPAESFISTASSYRAGKVQFQQGQKQTCQSPCSTESCPEPIPVKICGGKICPEMNVHVPQFIILPVIDETSTGQPVVTFVDVLVLPVVGDLNYPFVNAVDIITNAPNVTYTNYTVEKISDSPDTWRITKTVTIYSTNIWGHGPDNFDYYIGSGLVTSPFSPPIPPNLIDITPINYINYLSTPYPTAAQIAQQDDLNMHYLNPRGYLNSNLWGSEIYYFQFRAALKRVYDTSQNNSTQPYRYYIEFHRLDAPFPSTTLSPWPTLQTQLLTHIKKPEVGSDQEVPPVFYGPLPPNDPIPKDTDFNGQPDTIKNKVVLYGNQGWDSSGISQPWMMLSHSAEVNAIIPELTAMKIAEANYALTPNATTLAKLNLARLALIASYPKIRVYPSIERPICLSANIGIKPPCINTQYYIAKFFVGTYADNTDLLELTSTSSTQPIGAPIAYKHYTDPSLIYNWTVPAVYDPVNPGNSTLGVGPVIPYPNEPNQPAVEGYGTFPENALTPTLRGTICRLRFIPIISNNNYVGNVPVSLKNPDILISDEGVSMDFQLEIDIGLTELQPDPVTGNNHRMNVRRLTPFPQEYPRNILIDARYMFEPSLLLPNRYKLLPSINFEGVEGNVNPLWSPEFQRVDYSNQFEIPEGFQSRGQLANDNENQVFPSGEWKFHNRPRLLGESDDNTVILKIDWATYPNPCKDTGEIKACDDCNC